jgi:hypothetical protein
MTRFVLSALATIALTTELAAVADAQTQSPDTNAPVTVRSFSARPVLPPMNLTTFSTSSALPPSSAVTISFVNTGSVPAKSVEFALQAGNKTTLIVDKGTFSPGTSIVQTFNAGIRFYQTSSVRVQKVTFADGSTWNS